MTENTQSFYHAPGAPENPDTDYIVRATAYGGQVRALAIRSTVLSNRALEIHGMSPVATAALGRFLTGSLMLAENLKSKEDTQTTNIRCKGPIHGLTAVCNSSGSVRGYCNVPTVENTFHYPGKLDVGAAVGTGIFTVIRDLGLKEPYIGSVELVSGEIAEDFTYYLAVSEQTPSVMALGVLLGEERVLHAGGFLVQLLPGAGDDVIGKLEERAKGGFPDVTFLLEQGFNPEKILDLFLGDPDIQFLNASEVRYECNCSRDRMERNLITLGAEQLADLSTDKEGITLECHFCEKKYSFSQSDLQKLLEGTAPNA